MKELGRLTPVDDLREAFPKEDAHFTRWLTETNLDLLSEALGIELQLDSTQTNVGGFRADIVATNIADGSKVVIENQLNYSDHSHIGKAITYAAGLSASTVVWIAKKIREEHRAALDWLNSATNIDTRFIGIEVKLWKIEESKMAPQLVIVSQPNDWTRGPVVPPDGSIEQNNLDFWLGVKNELIESKSDVKPMSPKSVPYAFYSIGRTNFRLRASFTRQNKELQVALLTWGDYAKAFGEMLYHQREDIHRQLGHELAWTLPPKLKSTVISRTLTGVDPSDEQGWAKQFGWIVENLNAFNDAFRGRVSELDINEYTPNEPNPDEVDED